MLRVTLLHNVFRSENAKDASVPLHPIVSCGLCGLWVCMCSLRTFAASLVFTRKRERLFRKSTCSLSGSFEITLQFCVKIFCLFQIIFSSSPRNSIAPDESTMYHLAEYAFAIEMDDDVSSGGRGASAQWAQWAHYGTIVWIVLTTMKSGRQQQRCAEINSVIVRVKVCRVTLKLRTDGQDMCHFVCFNEIQPDVQKLSPPSFHMKNSPQMVRNYPKCPCPAFGSDSLSPSEFLTLKAQSAWIVSDIVISTVFHDRCNMHNLHEDSQQESPPEALGYTN